MKEKQRTANHKEKRERGITGMKEEEEEEEEEEQELE